MAVNELGLYVPDKLQRAVGYKDVEKKPGVVCWQTNQVLGLVAGGVVGNNSDMRSYLGEFTGPYLEAVAKGMFINTQHNRAADRPLVGEVLRRGRALAGRDLDPETVEAYGHFLTTCGYIRWAEGKAVFGRGRAVDNRLPNSRPSLGTLEFIDTLRSTVDSLARRKIAIDGNWRDVPTLKATILFFRASTLVPFRNERPDEVEKDNFEKLLGDVSVSF